jgi:hypothetical protein
LEGFGAVVDPRRKKLVAAGPYPVALAAEAVAKAVPLSEGDERKTLDAQAAFYRKEAARRRKDPDAK